MRKKRTYRKIIPIMIMLSMLITETPVWASDVSMEADSYEEQQTAEYTDEGDDTYAGTEKGATD